MKHYSTKQRHYSNQKGRELVNNYHGLLPVPICDTEINVFGENPVVKATFIYGTYPLSKIADMSPLEKYKESLRNTEHKTRVVQTISSPAPVPESKHEKKFKRITPLGWIAIISGVVASAVGVSAGIKAHKNS